MIRPLLLCLPLLLAALPLGAVPIVQAPPSEALALERARQLIEVTGAEAALEASALGSLDAQMALLPPELAVAPAERARFRALFQDEVVRSTPEVIEALAALWAMHFSPEELDRLIAFYRTPLGQKVLARMPTVMRQAQVIGARWGHRVGVRAMRRFEGATPDP